MLAKQGRDSVSVQLAPGLALDLWAPEPLISDPVGIGFDEKGRMYVTRTARTNRDEIDIRAHQDWMVPSMLFTDVEDKRAFYKRVLAPERSAQNPWLKDWNGDGSRDWRDLTVHKEGLYRLEDTNGDGIADVSQLLLEDFNDLVSDVAHGVLAYRNDLYLTVSPDVWRLRDTKGDSVLATKESIAHGSGVTSGSGATACPDRSSVPTDGCIGSRATWASISRRARGANWRIRTAASSSAPIRMVRTPRSLRRASATCRNLHSTSTAT